MILVLSTAALAQVGFNGPGRYEMANVDTGKLVGVDMRDRSSVVQLSTSGAPSVTWEFQPAGRGFFYIRNAFTGGTLQAVSDRNSTPVTAGRFTGAPNQQWRLEPGKDGNALIVSRSGKVLDVPDGDHRDGVRLQVYDRNGDANQRFVLRAARNEGRGALGEILRQGAPPARERVIRCSSNDGRRNTCVVDTSGGVRLLRQISGSPCVEGRTWGWDRRGVWVDQGCRADFDIGAGRERRAH